MSLLKRIETRLQAAFAPSLLTVRDESHEHAGHAGSQGGGQHFAVSMSADAFAGLTAVKRHQLVYAALHDLMREQHAVEHPHLGYIHALKLQLQS